MIVCYVFIGKLPSYIVENIKHTRLYFSGKIILIVDDLDSVYLREIEKYTIEVIPYRYLNDVEFITTVQENISRFSIVEKLGDRKLLFIRSFERFYLLKNLMKMFNYTDVLFLELDMLIYFNPEDYKDYFSQKDIAFTFTDKKYICTAICYVKSVEILENLTSYFTNFIKYSGEFISEMTALGNWCLEPGMNEKIFYLPGLWMDERYSEEIWCNYTPSIGLFDSMGCGVEIDGPDTPHRAEWEAKGRKWWGTQVHYYEYKIKERIIDEKRQFFIVNGEKEVKLECIHMHSKNLKRIVSYTV